MPFDIFADRHTISSMVTALAQWLEKHPKTTQTELAGRLGISQGQVSRIVRGEQPPNVDIAVAIERETGIPVKAWVQCSGR
jgi:transcriptional regulator with XRE-family HTH domain